MSLPLDLLGTNAADCAENLIYEALQLNEPERNAFLSSACEDDQALREKVDAFLQDHARAGDFLKTNAPEPAEFEADFARYKPEEAGDLIGNYKMLEQIGEGGFGTVWVAEQERPIRRRVALKIIKLGMDTKDVVARFEQERQALAMMDHPNIAKVLDAGATPTGRPFFAMELVRGIKITDYCDQANLPTTERLRLFIAVCHAVQHAHQKGIIHRDLKPSNILVTLHDGVPVPKVIDFGVAKATQQQRLTDLTVYTQFEQMIGTPLYMSPEQAEMSGLDIDTRSDVYSLGVLLYELLTGKTPFDAERLVKAGYDEMRRVIREVEPQKPSTLLSTMAVEARSTAARHRHSDEARLISTIKGDLDWIVMKALEKDRSRRYETANGFAKDLERHLNSEPVQARPASAGYRFRRMVRRNKRAFAAGAAIAAALLVGSAVSMWQAVRANEAISDLRGSAPAFAAMARGLVAKEQFDEAIENLDAAIKLRPDVPAYVLAKADLLQSQFRFAKAEPLYREALRLNPKETRAETNAALCETLAKESAAQPKLSRENLLKLFTAMSGEQRSAAEMMRVGKLIGEENNLVLGYWLDRLKELPIPPEKPLAKRLTVSSGGVLSLDLGDVPIVDLTPLKGMPLNDLDLSGCAKVADLEPLRGMPLRRLLLGKTRPDAYDDSPRPPTAVTDLSPLKGMNLIDVDLSGTRVSDLRPFIGMRLETLNLGETWVSDLIPLTGMPLSTLMLNDTYIIDLAPLKGMPLQELCCTHVGAKDFSPLVGAPLKVLRLDFTNLGNLDFLRGMPLEHLNLDNCHDARSYRILSELEKLEVLVLPAHFLTLPEEEVAAIAALRQHPTLKKISAGHFVTSHQVGNYDWSSSAAFWAQFEKERRAWRTLHEAYEGKGTFRRRSGGTWSLDLMNVPISDLSPLESIPISELNVSNTRVTNLTPLKGMPLEHLFFSQTLVTNLEPLKGLPLKRVSLLNCAKGMDVSPLAQIDTLEHVVLPPEARNVEVLKSLPNLIRISAVVDVDLGRVSQTRSEFFGGKLPVTVESLARERKFVEAEALLRTKNNGDFKFEDLVNYRVALGAVVCAQKNQHNYEALCSEMMSTYHMTTARSAATAAKICLLGSKPGVSLNELEKLVKEASRIQPQNLSQEVSLKWLSGLLEYRAVRPASALTVLNQIQLDEDDPALPSIAAILAMAYHQQGDREAAASHLARAREFTEQFWPIRKTTEGSKFAWSGWLIAHLLVEEAEGLIAPRPPGK